MHMWKEKNRGSHRKSGCHRDSLFSVHRQEIEDVYFGQDALYLVAAGDDDGVVLAEDAH